MNLSNVVTTPSTDAFKARLEWAWNSTSVDLIWLWPQINNMNKCIQRCNWTVEIVSIFTYNIQTPLNVVFLFTHWLYKLEIDHPFPKTCFFSFGIQKKSPPTSSAAQQLLGNRASAHKMIWHGEADLETKCSTFATKNDFIIRNTKSEQDPVQAITSVEGHNSGRLKVKPRNE